jgi:hypothetical protein
MGMQRAEVERLIKAGNHITFSLVGLSFECLYNHNFRTRQDAIQALVTQLKDPNLTTDITVLSFEPQPDNPHDANAIIVKMYDGTDIGFVPMNGRLSFAAKDCPDLWMLGQIEMPGMNEVFRGANLQGNIVAIKPGGKTFGIVVEVWVLTEG